MSELALVDHGAPTQLDVSYWGEVLVFAAQVADAVGDTEFVPGALRGRREAVAATIIYGAEVGLTPMQALAGIHIVDGRPAPSAELCRAMILRAGHTFHVVEMTGTRARVWGQRRGRPDSERAVVEWTLDMARAAGLLGRTNWQRYPRAMLVARATGDLARLLFPDVVKGLGYVAEDDAGALDAWAPTDSSAPTVETPARRTLQRRKRSAASTPVQTADLPAEGALKPDSGAPVAPVLDEVDVSTADAGMWLTDEEAVAREHEVAEQARAAVEEALDEPPPSAPPPYPKGHQTGDVPLPEDMRPVGSGRPVRPTLPDPEPEQPDDEGTGPPVALGDRPARAMQAGLTRELGTSATREERHALVAAILGHPVTSTKDLPRAEGYHVLDYLDRFADGSASWEFTEGGAAIRVLDTREPPPMEG